MRTTTTLLLVISAAFMVLANSAGAGSLVTGALDTGSGDRVSCRLVNGGKKDVTVTLEIVNYLGSVQATGGPMTVGAGRSFSASDLTPSIINYCRATGKGVSKGNSRLTYCVESSTNTPIECVTFP